MKTVETRMEKIAFVTEKLQLAMDVGEAIVEVWIVISVLLHRLTCLQGQFLR